jgi:hypothetical protein
MSQYPFSTRAYGPNAKGSTLTWEDLDNSLLFLSESINELNFTPLSGSNYVFVEANGTPTQNGLALSASYVQAKNSSPSSTNRIAVLAGPGRYTFASNFTLDTQYIDVVSLTGECDVLVTGSGTISVTANDVYVRGIDVDVKNFTVADNLPLLKVKTCKGGDYSFGGQLNPIPGSQPLNPILVNGTFTDCEGGDFSFAGNGMAYGTFTNCVGGDSSFGYYCDGIFTNCIAGDFSFGGDMGYIDGTMENCTAGDNSFAPVGNINSTAVLDSCVGGLNSFASGPSSTITGKLIKCRLTSGNFATLNAQPPGDFILCINSDNTTI